jgi:hypothetical protein
VKSWCTEKHNTAHREINVVTTAAERHEIRHSGAGRNPAKTNTVALKRHWIPASAITAVLTD